MPAMPATALHPPEPAVPDFLLAGSSGRAIPQPELLRHDTHVGGETRKKELRARPELHCTSDSRDALITPLYLPSSSPQLYSLHTEVYRLRVAESSNHSGGGRHASSSTASDLRRMQGSLRDAGGLAPYFLGSTTAPSRGSRDGIRPAQPRGFESTAPGTLAGALGMGALGAGYGAGALGLAAGAGDGFDPPGVGSGGGGLGVGSWRSETERKLAELMATRDLLRQAERGRRAPRPDAAPIPEYMQ